jgi:hypothetical protein
MGERGPAPKRSEERRRTNQPEIPLEQINVDEIAKRITADVEIPLADEDWHPTARMLFDSFAKSGQSVNYEPSDWAVLYVFCESLSRDLLPQFVGMRNSWNSEVGEMETKPHREKLPLKGASMAGYLKMCTDLMATEAARRRASVELSRHKVAGAAAEEGSNVTNISQRRADRV